MLWIVFTHIVRAATWAVWTSGLIKIGADQLRTRVFGVDTALASVWMYLTFPLLQ